MITLQNKGLLELDFIKTMGVNVKEGDSSIGYFGTGLKYAIAVFLREGINFQLFIGDNEFVFETESKIIRGKEFNLCRMVGPMDSVDLGFTTELGKNWDVWQAYRELHSNCLDEDGVIADKLLPVKSDCTTIYIHDDEAIGDIGDIFLHYRPQDILYSDDYVEIINKTSPYIYYQGIKAKVLGSDSIYCYNIKSGCTLTEDRLLAYTFQVDEAIANAIVCAAAVKPEISKALISATSGIESRVNLHDDSSVVPTEAFKQVVKEMPSVTESVTRYIAKYEPAKPKTKEELRSEFLSKLDEVCMQFNIDQNPSPDGRLIELTGDLLEY